MQTTQKFMLVLSYVGTHYCGWQTQKHASGKHLPSIQQTIQDAVFKITGERISVIGSGRTDAGVHALAQVAHLTLARKRWTPEILSKALNAVLPQDIRVLRVDRVEDDFHAQRSARKKKYSYYFQQGPCALPHLYHYTLWIRRRLDLKAMAKAAKTLKGTHDFKAFQGSGAATKTTVRKIHSVSVKVIPLSEPIHDFSLIRITLVGSGFLKQMVRGIAGTLLQVGEKKRPPTCMAEILASRDRRLVGPTAPPRALWLEQVWYD